MEMREYADLSLSWESMSEGTFSLIEVQMPYDVVLLKPVLRWMSQPSIWRDANSLKYIEDIQMFGVNMTFISSSEVKKCIFQKARMKYTFFHFTR